MTDRAGGEKNKIDADLMLTRHAERRQKSVGEEGELGQGAAGLMTHGGSHSVTRYSHTSVSERNEVDLGKDYTSAGGLCAWAFWPPRKPKAK